MDPKTFGLVACNNEVKNEGDKCDFCHEKLKLVEKLEKKTEGKSVILF
jgi:hypothetical protein